MRALAVYVAQGSQENFRIGLDKQTWGFKEWKPEYQEIEAGDWLVMGTGVSQGNVRASSEVWQLQTLREVIVGRLTTGVREDRTRLWPDETNEVAYPYRVMFEVVARLENIPLAAEAIGDELSEALRKSASRYSYGYVVQNVNGVEGLVARSEPYEPVGSLAELLTAVLELQPEYSSTNTEAMQRRGVLVRSTIPAAVSAALPGGLAYRTSDIAVEGRDGTGLKTRVPWVRVHSHRFSPRATEGWYVVYLFAADGSAVYLSLNQGTTVFEGGDFRPRPAESIRGRVDRAREVLATGLHGHPRFKVEMELKDSGDVGKGYERGNVAAVRYDLGSLPTEKELAEDLELALHWLVILYDEESMVATDDAAETPEEIEPVVAPPFDLALVRAAADEDGLEIDDTVLKAIVAALVAGKNVILTGPPGTAKTTLAIAVARAASSARLCTGHVLTTATSDWTTYETVGGLRPVGSGLEFRPGQVLQAIGGGRWLVIDELNRANFDRAFGQLFTVLSGQSVVLPYDDATSGLPVEVVLDGATSAPEGTTSPVVVPRSWRLIATMNVFDKSLLFEMSYALMRRFAFIEVPAPPDDTYRTLIRRQAFGDDALADRLEQIVSPLLLLRRHKELGPALFIDMARFAAAMLELDDGPVGELQYQLFYSYVLPQFEGISDDGARQLYRDLRAIIGGAHADQLRSALQAVLGVELGTLRSRGAENIDVDETDDES